ncbi:MAG: hypothetical protein PHD02_03720 [Bacilli bacterium]|nr:hypothetical protein [Bacilli bacterium]
MNIKMGDIQKINGKDYQVASIITEEEKDYYLISNVEDIEDVTICEIKENTLEEITNEKLFEKLTYKFIKKILEEQKDSNN